MPTAAQLVETMAQIVAERSLDAQHGTVTFRTILEALAAFAAIYDHVGSLTADQMTAANALAGAMGVELSDLGVGGGAGP